MKPNTVRGTAGEGVERMTEEREWGKWCLRKNKEMKRGTMRADDPMLTPDALCSLRTH